MGGNHESEEAMLASIRAFLWRLLHLTRRSNSEASLDRELEFHLQMEIEENLRQGISHNEARRRALVALGGLAQTKEDYRQACGIRWLGEFRQDLSFGIRILKKNRGFAAMIVMMLALGIGTNTALFSILNTVFFKPLPYPDAERLVLLGEAPPHQGQTRVVGRSSYEAFVDWSKQNQVFEDLAAYSSEEFNVAGGGEPHRIQGDRVSAAFFKLLRIQPILGRTFVPGDFSSDQNPVAILSYQYWQTAFGGRSDIVGQVIRIEGHATTIVGVMPERFRSSAMEGGARFWIPLVLAASEMGRESNLYMVMARLKTGITIERARNDMTLIARRLEQQYPDTRRHYPPSLQKGWGVRIEGMHSSFVQKGTATEARLLMTPFGFLLLIVCANVANLLLAKGADRRKEIGVRIALGAGRLRVVRQLLVESLLLALLGGGGGVLLANWSLPLLLRLRAGANLFAEFGIGKFEIDGRVLLFTLVISMASSLIFGIVPALTSSQVEPFETFKSFGSGHSSGVRRRRLSNMLVVSELTLSLLLMVSGGFVLTSLYRLWTCDWGFPLKNRLAISLSLSQRSYAEAAKRKQFFEELLSQVRALPGVRSAALMRDLPIMMQGAATRIRVGRNQGPDDSGPILTASCSSVSPDYWQTLGIPLKKGRLFTDQDTSRDVAVVSESMAREVWKGQDPIGKTIEVFRSWYTVVGVSGDVVNLGFARKPEYAIYVPSSFTFDTASLVLHTSGNPLDLVPPVRDIIKRMDLDQPVTALCSLEQAQAELGKPWEFVLVLLGSIAVAAVVVSAIGMYGVTSRTVAAQTREIGIRMALGASGGSVIAQVVRHGARLALLGIALGAAAALAAAKVLVSQYWWLASSQMPVIGLVALLLGAVALLACYLPARRASRIEPAITLRSE
jgi:putative ABC transport system permease protein